MSTYYFENNIKKSGQDPEVLRDEPAGIFPAAVNPAGKGTCRGRRKGGRIRQMKRDAGGEKETRVSAACGTVETHGLPEKEINDTEHNGAGGGTDESRPHRPAVQRLIQDIA